MKHDLKIWPDFFEAVMSGDKPFELRKNDRQYSVGDILRLREWKPGVHIYTGREITRTVSYVLLEKDAHLVDAAMPPGFVILGLRDMGQGSASPPVPVQATASQTLAPITTNDEPKGDSE